MKIWGIGANRTGTTSLTYALAMLGYKMSHYKHHEEITLGIKNENYKFDFLNDFDGALDLPIPLIFKQLDKEYPGSKFIFTIRDEDSWIRSQEKLHSGIREPIEEVYLMYGDYYFNREKFLKRYNEHNEQVRNYFRIRPNDFLEIDLTKGNQWEKLCIFLGRDIPNEEFPHHNNTQNIGIVDKIKYKLDYYKKIFFK